MPGYVESFVHKEHQETEQFQRRIAELQASIGPSHVAEVAQRLGFVPDDIAHNLRFAIEDQFTAEQWDTLTKNEPPGEQLARLQSLAISQVSHHYEMWEDCIAGCNEQSLATYFPKYEAPEQKQELGLEMGLEMGL